MPRRTTLAALIAGCLAAIGLAIAPAVAGAPATVTPLSISFGALHVGKPKTENITVKLSPGYSYQGVTGAGTIGAFQVDDTTSAACAAPGPGSCVLKETFTPRILATVHANTNILVCLTTNLDECTTYTVALSGSGQVPATFSPASFAFTSTTVGNHSTPIAEKVTLDPGYEVDGFTAGTDGPFDVVGVAPDCVGTVPDVTNTCSFKGRFTPTSVGSVTQTLVPQICPVNPGLPCVEAAIKMTGTGTAPGSVSPTSIAFGTVHLGMIVSRTITVKVLGGDHVDSAVVLDTGEGSPFAIREQSAGCDDVDGPTTCTLTVSYKPYNITLAALPAETSTIRTTLCTPDGLHCTHLDVAVNGRGAMPGTVSASSIAFGSVQAGSRLTKTVTVKPDPGWYVADTDTTTSGPDDVFSASTAACVQGAASCVVPVTFAPVAIGARSGSMRPILCPITDVSYEPCVTMPRVALTGTGTAPATVSPTSIAFGNVKVHSFLNRTVTLTIKPGWEISPDALSAGGPPFIAHKDPICTTSPFTKCTIQVTFAPQATGARTATLPLTVCQAEDALCVALAPVKLSGTGT